MKGAAKTKLCRVCGWVYPWHDPCPIPVMTPEVEVECLRALDAVTPENPATIEYRADYCGVSRWRTPDGWTLAVFNDCSEWDYVEYVVAPDGTEYHFPHVGDFVPRDFRVTTEWVARWSPLAENVAGWPHAAEDMGPDPRQTEVDGRPYPLAAEAAP